MVVQMAERYPDFAYVDMPGVSYRWHGAQYSSGFYASSEPLMGHLAIVEGVFERNAQHHLHGREREVAGHLKRRLDLYPDEQGSSWGPGHAGFASAWKNRRGSKNRRCSLLS